MAEAVSTFISYSRTDSDFVDRLEADLRARGFKTWVDRRKLEGTREWQPQIDYAIAEYPLMIVVLSPDAVASPYVRHEYEYAHQLGKRIVTLLHRPNLPTVPAELSKIQWVDFVNRLYETALVELIDGCQDPLFNQASDPRILYNEAHDLERSDPERAATLYQRLINRAPTYAGGRAQVDLDRLNQQLYPQRAQRLREQAETARKDGQYGAEAGALKALIALGDQDRSMLAWAEEYLPIAEQNSAWLDTYENVKHCVEVDDKERARDLLTDLWRQENAPFFRDPAGVALQLGLTAPMTYEEAKERRLANEDKAKRERDTAADRDASIARVQARAKAATDEENAKWQAACKIARSDLSQAGPQTAVQLRGWNDTSDQLLDWLSSRWQHQTSLNQSAKRVRSLPHLHVDEWAKKLRIDPSLNTSDRFFGRIEVVWAVGFFAFIAFGIVSIIVAVLATIVGAITGIDWNSLFNAIFLIVVLLILSYFIFSLVLMEYCHSLDRSLASGTEELTRLQDEWVSRAMVEHSRRLSDVRAEEQQLTSRAQAQYQQRMDEIAAEHARTLAEIAARYAGD